MQSGNVKKPWCCEIHSAESVQQGLTIALMSAPASSNILAKSLRPCRTARWRGLKPKNNKKKEKPAFYIHVQIFLHIEKTDISYRGTNKCLQSCLEIWQCDTTLTPDHKGRKCPLPTHTPKTTNPTHTWAWVYIFHTHQQTVKAVKEIIRIGVFTVVM